MEPNSWFQTQYQNHPKSSLQDGAPWLAKLVQITIITIVCMILITTFRLGCKPTYNWGAPSCGHLWNLECICLAKITEGVSRFPKKNLLDIGV